PDSVAIRSPCHELKVGDRIATESGAWVAAGGVEDTGVWTTVYNLSVAEHHTYFVGMGEWGFSVWAHNATGYNRIGEADVVIAQERVTGILSPLEAIILADPKNFHAASGQLS